MKDYNLVETSLLEHTSIRYFPNAFLVKEYLVASSRALWANPTAPAATCLVKKGGTHTDTQTDTHRQRHRPTHSQVV